MKLARLIYKYDDTRMFLRSQYDLDILRQSPLLVYPRTYRS